MIPFFRSSLGWREASAAARALRGDGQGNDVDRFEKEAAGFLGSAGAVAVGSGLSAVALALRALGAAPGREVIVPAFAPPSLLDAVSLTGAAPVPADVLWHDANLSISQVRRRLTHRTAAVIALHSFGASVELEPLFKLGVPVLEDVSQALGAHDYNRRRLGTFGRAAVACFGPEGLLSSGGEGGMVFSSDRRLLDAVREGCRSGATAPLGVPMTELQAAVGRVQLSRLPSFLSTRRRIADRVRAALAGLPLDLPLQIYGRVYHSFVLRCHAPVTEALIARFKEAGVAARRPLLHPLHWNCPGAAYPVAERVWRRSLALPFHPLLKEGDIQRLTSVVRRLLPA